jgi:hypothetical protein
MAPFWFETSVGAVFLVGLPEGIPAEVTALAALA